MSLPHIYNGKIGSTDNPDILMLNIQTSNSPFEPPDWHLKFFQTQDGNIHLTAVSPDMCFLEKAILSKPCLTYDEFYKLRIVLQEFSFRFFERAHKKY
jgi:hypothetical protein